MCSWQSPNSCREVNPPFFFKTRAPSSTFQFPFHAEGFFAVEEHNGVGRSLSRRVLARRGSRRDHGGLRPGAVVNPIGAVGLNRRVVVSQLGLGVGLRRLGLFRLGLGVSLFRVGLGRVLLCAGGEGKSREGGRHNGGTGEKSRRSSAGHRVSTSRSVMTGERQAVPTVQKRCRSVHCRAAIRCIAKSGNTGRAKMEERKKDQRQMRARRILAFGHLPFLLLLPP